MKNLKLAIAFGLIILAGACKKKQDVIEQPKPKDVYVVGYETNSSNIYVAKLWKNGVSTTLSDGSKSAVLNGVVLVGSDVYVCGNKYRTPDVTTPVLWKNGVATELPTAGGIGGGAEAIATNGTDVFVVGYEYGTTTKAVIWKNGVASYLPLDVSYNFYSGRARALAINGNDVYVVGLKLSATFTTIAIWKNGVYSTITDGTKYSEGYSIAVNGSDIYVLGNLVDTNTLWKNGVAIAGESGKDNNLRTVYASNNNIFIAGNENFPGGIYNAKIFKNGTPTIIAENAIANRLFVDGNDIYAVGVQTKAFPQITATVWKNGIATTLSDGTKYSTALGVYVK